MKKALPSAVNDAADDAVHNAADNDVMAQHTPSKASARPMHHISRLEEPEAGWQVDIRARNNRWQNLLADQAHGGTEQALASAQAWRDAVLLEMRRARGNAAPGEQRLTSRNTSGLVGVSRMVEAYQTAGGTTEEVARWVAYWRDLQGKKHVRKFAVKRYGEAQAQAMAARARQEGIQALGQQITEKLATASAIAPLAPAPMLDEPAMRGITRNDANGQGLGWNVSIKRQNQIWTKHFSDSTYGGHTHALAAAQAWRNEIGAQLSGPEYELWKRTRQRSTNTSGTVGVSRSVRTVVNKNGSITVTVEWQGYWAGLDGKRYARTFSVSKYGEEQAKALACRFREEGLEQVREEAAQRPWDPEAFAARGVHAPARRRTKTTRAPAAAQTQSEPMTECKVAS